MLENWDNAIITHINMAVYVAANTGKAVHINRPFHGFVFNDATAYKIIHFSDGTSITTGPYELHYLPKGSDYRVESIVDGGCWAINFDLLEAIDEKPFNIQFRNHEAIFNDFKDSIDVWKEKTNSYNTVIRKNIYDIIVKIKKEKERNYLPSKKELLIKPAIDFINRNYTKNDLSVKNMAELCCISEAYFRRIFIDKYSISPKEYIINLKIGHAKHLLECDQFMINEIAELCGYFEPCHFSREFKKHTGISPAEYAKASRK